MLLNSIKLSPQAAESIEDISFIEDSTHDLGNNEGVVCLTSEREFDAKTDLKPTPDRIQKMFQARTYTYLSQFNVVSKINISQSGESVRPASHPRTVPQKRLLSALMSVRAIVWDVVIHIQALSDETFTN